MEFIGRLITIVLIFTLLPIFFAILYTKKEFLKKCKIFKDFLQIEEAYKKLKQRDYRIEENIEYPLHFNSSVTLLFALIGFCLFVFFFICILGRVQLDRSMSTESNVIFNTGFSLFFLLLVGYFLRRGRVTILKEDGIKTASYLKLLLTLGKLDYIAYHEIEFLRIRVIFGGGGLGSYSADCDIQISSKIGELQFSANAGTTYDTLLLIAVLKEKLGDKIEIVHKSKRCDTK